MKRLLGILLLLIHINTSMFIPVMDEQDIYDEHGHQVSDINTLTQFISQEILGHSRVIDHDQDDDQAHFFNIKVHQYTFHIFQPVISNTPVYSTKTCSYSPPTDDQRMSSVTYDVAAPPPWLVA